MIGLLNDCFPPIMDGVAVTTSNYAYWLQQKRGDICVITPHVASSSMCHYDYPVFHYWSLPIPMRKPYRMGLPRLDYFFWQEVNHIHFELLHAHCPFSSAMIARRIVQKQHVPLVATFHSKYKADFSRVIHNKFIIDHLIKNIVSFYEQADEVWIPQPAVEETLREYGYRGKVEVVENGNDFVGLYSGKESKIMARRFLHLDEHKAILLFVGQHIWEKNVDFILRAIARLKHVKFTMIFVGTGYAASQMKQMAKDLGLNVGAKWADRQVIFVGAVHDRDLMRHYYEAADLFLFPSLYDNAPLVVREAAALHTPAVLLRGATAAEIIVDGYNGFLSEVNEGAYATLIENVLKDSKTLEYVGDGAANTLARSWENIAEEVSDRYTRLIKKFNNLHA